jgi:hypothetical protein
MLCEADSGTTAAEQQPARVGRALRAMAAYWEGRRTAAFLLSLIVHTSILLILALWTIHRHGAPGVEFDFEWSGNAPSLEPPSLELLATGDNPPPPQTIQDSSIEEPARTTMASITVSELLAAEAPRKAPSTLVGELQQILNASGLQTTAAFSATGVEGRELKNRQQVALANGGSVESEQAVEAALHWLAEHQRPNGSWSLLHSAGSCNGRCGNDGSRERFDTAATGLSLLAFLGAGYTHRDGKHRETVRRGVYFLLQVIEETPQGGSFLYQCDRGMYNHGIAAFALCEAYQLTGDSDLKQPAQQAIRFIASAQNDRGGWGYLPQAPGDLTISGWQVMALKSAFAAQLDVSSPAILKIDSFLDSQQDESQVFYGYRRPGKSPTCTAIAHLLHLFRGRTHSAEDRSANTFAAWARPIPTRTSTTRQLVLISHRRTVLAGLESFAQQTLIASQSQSGHEAGSESLRSRGGATLHDRHVRDDTRSLLPLRPAASKRI